MEHYPKQVLPGQPQPVSNYVSYCRVQGGTIEQVLVRNGLIVGHWTVGVRLGLPLRSATNTLNGTPFSQVGDGGFQQNSPDVTNVLVMTYHYAARRPVRKGGGQSTPIRG